jgi:5-formyltetrahydrofolate cyclo-ligase
MVNIKRMHVKNKLVTLWINTEVLLWINTNSFMEALYEEKINHEERGSGNIMDKKELRKKILEMRDQQKPADRALWDDIVYNKFIGSEYYRNSKVIFIFVSFRSEVDTHRIIRKALEDGKVVGVPKVVSKKEGMKVFRIDSISDLEAGYFGVLEPKEGCRSIPAEEIDLIVMPGAAFDRVGGRIGYGGGFYDRYLADMGADVKKIALAYRMQVLEKVPMDENDMRVGSIITN